MQAGLLFVGWVLGVVAAPFSIMDGVAAESARAHRNLASKMTFEVLRDSQIPAPPYRDLLSSFTVLAKKHPGLVSLQEFGKSVQGRPLIAIRIAHPRSVARSRGQRSAVLITGLIHGDEYLAVEDRLPGWFVTEGLRDVGIREFIASGGAIFVIPVVNPDGFESRKRRNANGEDLNRDFPIRAAKHPGFTQPETRALGRYVHEEIVGRGWRLDLTLDYHCCSGYYKDGMILRPWSFKDPVPPKIPTPIQARYARMKQVFLETFKGDFYYGTTSSGLGYGPVGTTKDYYYENYGSLSYTYEGRIGREDRYFKQHALLWSRLIGELVRMPVRTATRGSR